ncbi:MAG: sulfotransferase [Fimbriimonas ginsengisoli]|uniref:Sulfotransferase n=1 Tax=Fimbriimonas ginsengisoli TaxID=1005039 RepID=A0A931LZU6_FIMGI|nr:sulfotransferase [Fimbriimonas ginsengisoli]
MTIIVLGMPRSGTSLLAKLLLDCGLDFGTLAEMARPHELDNPDGYWENVRVINLNKAILAVLGGSEVAPPNVSPGWSKDPKMRDLKRKARDLVADLSGPPYWGWKDPRTMLTLELWQAVLPDARYAFIFRNPFEVALSFAKRNDYLRQQDFVGLHHSVMLWRLYHEVALPLLPPDRTVFVSYGRLMSDCAAELPRIVEATGLPATEGQIVAARQSVKPELYRNRFPDSLIRESPAAEVVRDIWERLVKLAGEPEASETSDGEQVRMVRALFEAAFKHLGSADDQVEVWRDRAFQLHAYARKLETQLGIRPSEQTGLAPK